MTRQISANVCPQCRGKGFIEDKDYKCENCRGSGLIGSDGSLEYYIQYDQQGTPRVLDVKAPFKRTQSEDMSSQQTKEQKSKVIKGLLLALLILFYCGFLGLHIFIVKDNKVFIVVSTICLGSLIFVALYDQKFMNKLSAFLIHFVLKEPNDFMKTVKGRALRNNS